MLNRYRIKNGTTRVFWSLVGGICFLLMGCEREKPRFIYMPDMVYSPAIKAQEEGQRLPPEGAIHQNHKSYEFEGKLATEIKGRENPFRPTRQILERGKQMFDTFCIVCHGPGGQGDGTIVPKFPRPPSLVSEKIRAYTDGQIFHVMTVGQNLMPRYSYQVKEEDRWAITLFIRALQRAEFPKTGDLPAATNAGQSQPKSGD